MSILSGIANHNRIAVSQLDLHAMVCGNAGFPFASLTTELSESIVIGMQAFLTTKRTALNQKPVRSSTGNIAALDGRLDNYRDLCAELSLESSRDPSDSFITLAAYETWGEACFEHFYGDWAIALWDDRMRRLYLSRDHAGTCSLFYEQTASSIRFSSLLETLSNDKPDMSLNKHYLTCYLADEFTDDQSPYRPTNSVPPGYTLRFTNNTMTRIRHWTPRCGAVLRYKCDGDYEHHFLRVLTTAIEHRTPRDENALAHLSGGRDSSTIVCISDYSRRLAGAGTADLIDTVSYFDGTEPHWNELPFINAVERSRGKKGIHIDASAVDFDPCAVDERYSAPCLGVTPESELYFERAISGSSYSSIIAGTGGDELLGGVPNPIPELMDLTWAVDFKRLVPRCLQWSLVNRTTMGATIFELICEFGRLLSKRAPVPKVYAPWINNKYITNTATLTPHPVFQIPTVRPSNIHDQYRWPALVGHISSRVPTLFAWREYKYPFLDRELVEFVLRMPREQLVRPGESRSLMRRSLRGIVPDMILDRKRKAFVSRRPHAWLNGKEQQINHLLKETYLEMLGCINGDCLRRQLPDILALRRTEWSLSLARLINLELWIRARFNLKDPVGAGDAIPRFDATRASQGSA